MRKHKAKLHSPSCQRNKREARSENRSTLRCILSLTNILKFTVFYTGRPYLELLTKSDSSSAATVRAIHTMIEPHLGDARPSPVAYSISLSN